ncbi:MAG: hypothetical protein JKY55_07760 [Aliivibrio sp.]|uniref:NACHT domain-containing protein n=1 Tax=Aliivibrio sp. TaxID=1872443 RepID=UPI001A64698C|nr:hypothetical protein [Aliivibrio sp.]
MSELIILLTPVIGKLVIGMFWGETSSAIGGTVLTYLSKKIPTAHDAKSAEKASRIIGKSIASQIDANLDGEGAAEEEKLIVANELAYLLERLPLAKLAIDSSMNEAQIGSSLRSIKPPPGLSEREVGYFNSALLIAAKNLRKVSPLLEGFEVEKTEVILTSLKSTAEKIDSLIDGSEKIYDLLKSAISEFGNLKPSQTDTFNKYTKIYKNATKRLCNYVEIIGLDDITKSKAESELNVAYLSLNTRENGHQSTDFKLLFNKILLEGGRMIIEGAAGSGKSTLLRWATINAFEVGLDSVTWQSLFTSQLDSLRKANLYWHHELNTQKLKITTDNKLKQQHATRLKHTILDVTLDKKLSRHNLYYKTQSSDQNQNFIPFLIRLREHDGGVPSIDELPKLLSPSLAGPPSGWIEEVFEDGRPVLLFDGVDEVPEGERRNNILKQIKEYSDQYPKIPIIVSTRPYAFEKSAVGLDKFSIAIVEDLDQRQQKEFISNWHTARQTNSTPEEVREILSLRNMLLNRFDVSPVLMRLAANPLLCAAICALHEFDREALPEDERSLCEALTKMLAYKRDITSGRNKSMNMNEFGSAYQIPYEKKKKLIATIAAAMLRGGQSKMDMTSALRLIPTALQKIGLSELKPVEVCKALVARSGVIRGASLAGETQIEGEWGVTNLPEGVEFVHNRFKEWLASTHFLSEGTSGELANRALEDGFFETCAFAAAAPDQELFVSDLVKKLMGNAAKEKDMNRKRRLNILAVKCSLVAQSLSSNIRSEIDSLSRSLLPPKTMEEAKTLADLGDLAIDKLKYRVSRKVREATFCIRCLSLINSPKVAKLISEYKNDKRWTVIDELSRHIEPLSIPIVEEFVTSIQDEEKRYLRRRIIGRAQSIPIDFCNGKTVEHLNLITAGISSFNSFEGCETIKSLHLNCSHLKDIDALKKFKALNYVSLWNANRIDYSPIWRLQKIRGLDLWSSKIRSIDFENEQAQKLLQKLHEIALADTDITDIIFLGGATKLKGVDISSTSISKFDTLGTLKTIEVLNAQQTKIKKIDGIENLVNLYDVDFGRTKVSDISQLSSLNKLKSIGLHDTKVSKIDAMTNLKKLEAVYLGQTKIQDLKPLQNLAEKYKLKHIVVQNNPEFRTFIKNLDKDIFYYEFDHS